MRLVPYYQDLIDTIQVIFLIYNAVSILAFGHAVLFRIYFQDISPSYKKLIDVLVYYLNEIFYWILIVPNVEMWITALVAHGGYSNPNMPKFLPGTSNLALVILGLILYVINSILCMLAIPAKVYFNPSNGNAARRVRSYTEMILIQIRALFIMLHVFASFMGAPSLLVLIFAFFTTFVYLIDYYMKGKFDGKLGILYGYMVHSLLWNNILQFLSYVGVFPEVIMQDKIFMTLGLFIMPFILKFFMNLRIFLRLRMESKGLTSRKKVKYDLIDSLLREVQEASSRTKFSLANIFELSNSLNFIITAYRQDAEASIALDQFAYDNNVNPEDLQRELVTNRTLLEDFVMFLYHRAIKLGLSRNNNANPPPITFLVSYLGYTFYEANRKQKAIKNAYSLTGKLEPNSTARFIMEEIIHLLQEDETVNLEAEQRKFHGRIYGKVFELEEEHQNLTSEMDTIRKKYIEFYTLVTGETIDLNELDQLGTQVTSSMTEVNNRFKRLYSQRSENLDFVYDYANFLSKIKMASPAEYQFLLIKSQELLNKKLALRKTVAGFISLDDYLDADKFVMAIDVDRDIGRILDITASVAHTFGYEKKELEGKHLNSIIPDYFAPLHNSYLSSFANNNKVTSVVERQNVVAFGLTKEKLIIPLQIFVKAEFFRERLSLLGIIHKRKKSYATALILTDMHGAILGYNQNFLEDISFEQSKLAFYDQIFWLFAPKLIHKYYPDIKLTLPRSHIRRRTFQAASFMSEGDISYASEEVENDGKSQKGEYRQWRHTPAGFDGSELIQIYFFKHPKMNDEFFQQFLRFITARFAMKHSVPCKTQNDFNSFEIEEFKRAYRKNPCDFCYEECEIYIMRVSIADQAFYEGQLRFKKFEVYSYRKVTDPYKREQILALRAVQEANYEIQEVIKGIKSECGIPFSLHNDLSCMAELTKKHRDSFVVGGFLSGSTLLQSNKFPHDLTNPQVTSNNDLQVISIPYRNDDQKGGSAGNRSHKENSSVDSKENNHPDRFSLGAPDSRGNDGRKSSIAGESSISGIPEEDVFRGTMLSQNGLIEFGTETFREGLAMLREGLQTQRFRDTERDLLMLTTHKGLQHTGRDGWETPREMGWKVDDGLPSAKRVIPGNPFTMAQYQNIVPANHSMRKDVSPGVTPNMSFSVDASADHPFLRHLGGLRSPRSPAEVSHLLLDGPGTKQKITEQEEDSEEVKEQPRERAFPSQALVDKLAIAQRGETKRDTLPISISSVQILNSPKNQMSKLQIIDDAASDVQSGSFRPSQAKSLSRAEQSEKNNFLGALLHGGGNILGKLGEYFSRNYVERHKKPEPVTKRSLKDILVLNPNSLLHLDEHETSSQFDDRSSSSSSLHISEAIHQKNLPKSVLRIRWFGVFSYIIVAVILITVSLQLRYIFTQLTDIMVALMEPVFNIYNYFSALKQSSMLVLVNENKFLQHNLTHREEYLTRVSYDLLQSYHMFKGNFSAFMFDAFKPTTLNKFNPIQEVWVDVPGEDAHLVANTASFSYATYMIANMLVNISQITNQQYAYRTVRSNAMWQSLAGSSVVTGFLEAVSSSQSSGEILTTVVFTVALFVSFVLMILVILIYRSILNLKQKILCLFCTLNKESLLREIERLSRPLDVIFNMDNIDGSLRKKLVVTHTKRGGKRAISTFKKLKKSYWGIGLIVGMFYSIIVVFFAVTSAITYQYINYTVQAFNVASALANFPLFLVQAVGSVAPSIAHDQKNTTDFYNCVGLAYFNLANLSNSSLEYMGILSYLTDPPDRGMYTNEFISNVSSMYSGDFCPFVTNSTGDLTRCQSLSKNTSKSGIYASGKYIAGYYDSLFSRFLSVGMNVSYFAAELADPEFEEADQFFEYVIRGMELILGGCADNLIRLSNLLENIQIVSMYTGLVFFAILFLAGWGLFILRMSVIIQNSKILLGLVPVEILISNVYVKNFFKRGI